MHLTEHRQHRRFNHGFAHLASGSPADVLAWFGAMQAQDYASARWALGVRCTALSEAAVMQAIEEGRIVRTWALRNTLQLISARDVHWLIGLIGPVMLARNAARYRKYGLDAAGFEKVDAHIRIVLHGGQKLTREELFAALEQGAIDTTGMRGACILYRAALSGCICPASLRGKQQTYALLDEWVPVKNLLDRDAALGELALRYFRSHGPASLRDFAWWSGLSLIDARRGLSLARLSLREVHIGEEACWLSQSLLPDDAGSPSAHLLPAFDEYFLGYANRTLTLESRHFPRVMTNNGIFRPTMLVDGEIVGIWARTLKKGAVSVASQPFRKLANDEMEALNLAARRHADFLGLRCDGVRF
ncbi:MAG TPA: winged helix DNA-binding domain-containing protein [Rhodocyclaceae bacterium]|nr:winged helix DNA-binding domain-containing protein [Rhodocyclaceae bacterium]